MSKAYYQVGRYACKVVAQALGEASTGNPQFVLRFQVMGQVDPKDPSHYIPAEQQYERTHYRSITDKTIDYFTEDLKLLGFAGSSFKDLDPSNDGFHDFRGLDIDMWCAHERAQDGGDREKWSVARQGGDFKVDPLDAKKVRDLDNLFGKQLKSVRSEKPVVSNAPAQQPAVALATGPYASGVDDSDLPF